MKSTRFLIGGYGYGLAILILLFYTGVSVLQLLALAANRDPGVLPFWIALTGTAAAPCCDWQGMPAQIHYTPRILQ